jgi:nitronate monooxygenase
VQLGTRFLATEESSADAAYKQAVVDATREDILVARDPGSPCGLPFRILRRSPMFRAALARKRKPACNKGYVLTKDGDGRLTRCLAKEEGGHHFCICNGLLSSAGYDPGDEEPLYTVGSNAYRVDRVVPVKALMDELRGAAPASRAAGASAAACG